MWTAYIGWERAPWSSSYTYELWIFAVEFSDTGIVTTDVPLQVLAFGGALFICGATLVLEASRNPV